MVNFNPIGAINNLNVHSSAKVNETPQTTTEDKKDGNKKLKTALIGLGVIGAATVGGLILKKSIDAKNIAAIKEAGQNAVNTFVQETSSRGADAVNTYNNIVNATKIESLQYKINHGMIPKQGLEQAKQNLEMLLQNAAA